MDRHILHICHLDLIQSKALKTFLIYKLNFFCKYRLIKEMRETIEFIYLIFIIIIDDNYRYSSRCTLCKHND